MKEYSLEFETQWKSKLKPEEKRRRPSLSKARKKGQTKSKLFKDVHGDITSKKNNLSNVKDAKRKPLR